MAEVLQRFGLEREFLQQLLPAGPEVGRPHPLGKDHARSYQQLGWLGPGPSCLLPFRVVRWPYLEEDAANVQMNFKSLVQTFISRRQPGAVQLQGRTDDQEERWLPRGLIVRLLFACLKLTCRRVF